MPAGDYDSRGIWIYGEDDPASPFSTLLNLLAESVSDQLAADRSRLTALEARGSASSWTPVFNNLTVGNGALQATYGTLGDFVVWSWKLVFGTTTTVPGVIASTLPTLSAEGVWTVPGAGYTSRGSTTTGRQVLAGRMTGATTFNLWFAGQSLGATSPFTGGTWASGDVIAMSGVYRKA